MKSCMIFIFFGLAAQLDGSVLQTGQVNLSDADVDAVVHKRVTRGVETITPAKDDSSQSEKEIKESKVHARRHLNGEALPADADKKVLAFGLDTGAPAESKNGVVQAISDAFGGLMERPHVRSRGKGYKYSDEDKKPLALEVKSESILRTLERFLASPKVKKITNDIARKVAVIYRAIEKEL